MGLLYKRRQLGWRSKIKLTGLLFVMPVVIGTLIFDMGPLLVSTWLSFTSYRTGVGAEFVNFVGFDNFYELLGDEQLWSSLGRTAYYVGGVVPLGLIIGLMLALLLYHRGSRLPGAGWFQTFLFVPYVTTPVAIGLAWLWIYSNDFGLLNGVLWKLGFQRVDWLGSHVTVMPALIAVGIWHIAGYNMVLFMSGLPSIPGELYEAASIDGATSRKQFLYITLPLITPIIFFIIIISVIASFQVFDLIYVMTQGGPGYASSIIVYYLYQNAFEYHRFGYVSAMVLFVFAIIGFITWLQWKFSERWVFYQ